MKGGHTPIHIQRWAPADYQSDEHVSLLLKRRAWGTLTFYRQFIDLAFLSGGDLPADPEALAAVLRLPRVVVAHGLAFCLGRLLYQEGDRLYQKRVRREVLGELEYRQGQHELGKLGGRPKTIDKGKGAEKGTLSDKKSPPAPSSAPSPAPSSAPSPAPSSAPAPDRGNKTPVGAGSAGSTREPASQPRGGVLDHDPNDPNERRLAEVCEQLARLDADREGRPVTDEDRREALTSVTYTKRDGAVMERIRKSSPGWVAASIDAGEKRLRDEGELSHDPPEVPSVPH